MRGVLLAASGQHSSAEPKERVIWRLDRIGPPLSLRDREPFARGSHRHCYAHPDDPGLCVKVPALADNTRCMAEQRRDLQEQAALRRSWPTAIFDRIPAIQGTVDTDRGVGIVLPLYRDADGGISRSLARLIRERGLPAFAPAIDDWKRWMRRQRLITRDTGPYNIVAVHLAASEWKLFIAEGWLHRRYCRLGSLHPAIGGRLVERQLRKFDRRAATLSPASPC